MTGGGRPRMPTAFAHFRRAMPECGPSPEVRTAMLTGHCCCGYVRYRIDGQPSKQTLCHCATCRRASGAPVVALLPPASSSSAGSGYRRAPGAIERDAIYAAFEGRSEMAAKLYEQLASGGGDRIFALAARLAREDQVRKPVISH